LTGHQNSIPALVIGPDDRWLASGDEGGMVLLWDMASLPGSAGSPIRLTGHIQGITAMRASRDGRWLVTASADATARLWDVPALLGAGSRAPDASAAFVLRGHERSILALALSADSRWLATGSFDGVARLWDLSAPDPSASPIVLRGHRRGIFSMAVSPDDHWLITGSQDATIRLWTLRTDELVDLACRTAGRNLTAGEWAQYFPGQAYRATCAGLSASE
jgi:WD40 repeat protein